MEQEVKNTFQFIKTFFSFEDMVTIMAGIQSEVNSEDHSTEDIINYDWWAIHYSNYLDDQLASELCDIMGLTFEELDNELGINSTKDCISIHDVVKYKDATGDAKEIWPEFIESFVEAIVFSLQYKEPLDMCFHNIVYMIQQLEKSDLGVVESMPEEEGIIEEWGGPVIFEGNTYQLVSTEPIKGIPSPDAVDYSLPIDHLGDKMRRISSSPSTYKWPEFNPYYAGALEAGLTEAEDISDHVNLMRVAYEIYVAARNSLRMLMLEGVSSPGIPNDIRIAYEPMQGDFPMKHTYVGFNILDHPKWREYDNEFEEGWWGNPKVFALAPTKAHKETCRLAAEWLNQMGLNYEDDMYKSEKNVALFRHAYYLMARVHYPNLKLYPGDECESWAYQNERLEETINNN